MKQCTASCAAITLTWIMTALLVLCFILPVGLTGCGRKGDPTPNYSSQLFSWRNVFAAVSDAGCLSVSGSVGGASYNVESMVLELQPYDSSCAGCPFVPQETFRISATEAWEAPGGDTFRFAYCPADRAGVYRWRLVGRNVYSSLPLILTPVRIIGGDGLLDTQDK